jgi:hypothetical protein
VTPVPAPQESYSTRLTGFQCGRPSSISPDVD